MSKAQPCMVTASWKALYDRRNELDQFGLQPVRISVGRPRYWSEARGFPFIEELSPGPLFGQDLPRDEFRRAYWRRLDQIGAAVIVEKLRAIQTKTLALACFERSSADCHRGDFVVWYAHRTGEIVREWLPGLPLDIEAEYRRAGE